MKSRSKNFWGVFLASRKAVLGAILVSVISYALASIGGSKSAMTGAGSHKVPLSTAAVPSQTVNRPAGNEAKKGQLKSNCFVANGPNAGDGLLSVPKVLWEIQ